MTFQWSEMELCWLVIHDGNIVDKVGMQYAEQNPNWRETYTCMNCKSPTVEAFCDSCRERIIKMIGNDRKRKSI